MAAEARFSAKEAAVLANACIVSTATGRNFSLRQLVDEKKVAEAARRTAGSFVSVKTVSKEMDERIIKVRVTSRPSRRRYVGKAEIMYLASACLARPLNLRRSARTKVYDFVTSWTKVAREGRKAPERFELARHFAYEPGMDFSKWMSLIEKYSEALDGNVTSDPDIMGGVPVIKGTRVPVYSISALTERGVSLEKIKDDYPYLSDEAIEAAVFYARAHPRIGRRKKTFR
jgi:uncharacterized protein (DUF433 family)